MKKLLTAAVASTFAFLAMGVVNGDPTLPTGTSFEERDSTNLTWSALVDYTDAGGLVGDLYWYASPSDPTEEVGVITNYNGDAYSGARPKKFVDESAAQDKFLRIETSDPLFRAILPWNGEGGTQQVDVAEGIYLDTLVMFTPADGVENLDLANGDKIAISYVEHSEPDEKDESIWTNFVIRAGYVTGAQTVVATNYFAEVPAGVDMSKDTWHRLTVRAIKLGDGTVGFVIYLDGDMNKMLTYDTGVAAGYEDYTTQLANNSLVNQYLYNSTVHALFPSAVRSGTEKSSLTSVAFKGNGAIDDLSFTDDKPTFIAETTSVTVTWTPGEVTSVKLNSDTAVDAATLAAGSATVEPTNKVVSISVEFADGYVMGACAVTGGSGDWNGSDAFINLSAGATCEIVAMQPRYSVGDKYFEDVDAAITEAEKGTSGSPATLKLLANVSKSLTIGNEAYVVIDLNGKTITGDEDSGAAIVNGGATLTITNSSDTVGHVVPYEDGYLAVLLTAGTTTYITAGSFDGPVDFDGFDPDYGDVFVITGGSFLDEVAAGVPEDFYLKDYVELGLDVTADGDYFQVGESGGSGDEDWPADPTTVRGETAEQAYGITGELASADAESLAIWAKGTGNVDFADKGTINIDCFLLNIANNSTAQEIQDEKDEFIVNISFDSVTGEPVVTTPDGKTYNGKFKVYGSDDLTTPKASWHEQTDGDTFFYGKLVP